MESITVKLANIERTAREIVESAGAKKQELDEEMQRKRDQFDKDLEKQTNEKLDQIRGNMEKAIATRCRQEEEKNQKQIALLKKQFEKKHSFYAKEIVKRIVEV